MYIIQSEFLKLSKNDFVKGLVVTIFAAIMATIEQALTTSTTIDSNIIIHVALIAGLSYLSKNLLTTSNGKVLGAI